MLLPLIVRCADCHLMVDTLPCTCWWCLLDIVFIIPTSLHVIKVHHAAVDITYVLVHRTLVLSSLPSHSYTRARV